MMDDDSSVPNKKMAVLEKRESNFGSSNGRIRSYQEEAAVAPELRSRLESIGMRTRFSESSIYKRYFQWFQKGLKNIFLRRQQRIWITTTFPMQ